MEERGNWKEQVGIYEVSTSEYLLEPMTATLTLSAVTFPRYAVH